MRRLLVLLCLLPVVGGCFGSGKNPVRVLPPAPLAYQVASSPQNVLGNLVKAYTERDTTHYRECYDLSYVGNSYNGFDAFPPVPATYSFDDEAEHISALRRATSIHNVILDLPNYAGAPMDTLPGDPVGWVTIRILNPKVEIDDASGSTVIATGETFEFKFVPTAVSTAVSPTGKLWKIIRWTEISP